MRMTPIASAALVTVLCWLPACQSAPPQPEETLPLDGTIFRVYDLGDMYPGDLDDDKARTFTSMIRDAVGNEEWMETQSNILILDDVLMIRTTLAGHESLSSFFNQFRSISER